MLEQIASEIAQEYAQNAVLTRKGSVQLIPGLVRRNNEEGYSAVYSSKSIVLESENVLSAAFGASFLSTVIPSGHYAEFLGKSEPHIQLRPLWIGSEVCVHLTDLLGLNIPAYLVEGDEQVVHQLCKRIIELGYNSVMFGVRENAPVLPAPHSAEKIPALFRLIRQYKLKIIIKPHFIDPASLRTCGRSPFHLPYKKIVQEAIKGLFLQKISMDYLYWEGSFFYPDCIHHPTAKLYTQADLAKAEVEMLEQVVYPHTKLIYCLPAIDLNASKQQAHWFAKFCDDVGNHTSLAFPVVAGEPCSDHLPLHPFWEVLRKCPDASYTKLIPIMNTGGIKQGEGLWPSLSFDLFDRYISRCYRHHFGGVIGLVNHLPAKGGLLDCNLWVASQMMWRRQSAEILAETWFAAHQPELDYPQFAEALRQVREIVIQLSSLRSLTIEKNRDTVSHEECRLMTDSLTAHLKHLRLVFNRKTSKKAASPTFADYYASFLKDAGNIILHFLQCFNIPLNTVLSGEDSSLGFWTDVIQGTGHGIRAGAKVKFLDEPKPSSKHCLENKMVCTNFLNLSK